MEDCYCCLCSPQGVSRVFLPLSCAKWLSHNAADTVRLGTSNADVGVPPRLCLALPRPVSAACLCFCLAPAALSGSSMHYNSGYWITCSCRRESSQTCGRARSESERSVLADVGVVPCFCFLFAMLWRLFSWCAARPPSLCRVWSSFLLWQKQIKLN